MHLGRASKNKGDAKEEVERLSQDVSSLRAELQSLRELLEQERVSLAERFQKQERESLRIASEVEELQSMEQHRRAMAAPAPNSARRHGQDHGHGPRCGTTQDDTRPEEMGTAGNGLEAVSEPSQPSRQPSRQQSLLELGGTSKSGRHLLQHASEDGPEMGYALSITSDYQDGDALEYFEIRESIASAAGEPTDQVAFYDIKPNMWSCGIYILVEDIPYMMRGQFKFESLLRCTTITAFVLLNLGLQVAFCLFIYRDLLQPAIHTAQEMYATYHALAFDSNGAFVHKDFVGMGQTREALCQIPLSNILFLAAVVFLWVTTCVKDMVELAGDFIVFHRLPNLPAGISITEMFIESGSTPLSREFDLLVCISRRTRILINMFVFLPQIGILFCVCFIGSCWLVGTLNFGDLILNSLALEFVVGIDELLFECFMPTRLKSNLAKMKVAYPKAEFGPLARRGTARSSSEEAEAARRVTWTIIQVYTFSILTFALVLGVVAFILYGQQVIPGYAWDVHAHCRTVMEAAEDFLCYPLEKGCWPFGEYTVLAQSRVSADMALDTSDRRHKGQHS